MIKASFKSIHCCHGTSQGYIALNFIVQNTGFLNIVNHFVFNWNTDHRYKKDNFQSTQKTYTSIYYDATCCCTVVWIILATAATSNQQCHLREGNKWQLHSTSSVDMLHLFTKTDKPNITYVLLQNIVTPTIHSHIHTILWNAATVILYCSECISFLTVLMSPSWIKWATSIIFSWQNFP
jgi:hypothetical protein